MAVLIGYIGGEKIMTNELFIKAFEKACKNYDYKEIKTLATMPILQNWFNELLSSGASKDDDYYAYSEKNTLDYAIGTRLSILGHALHTEADEQLVATSSEFPHIAESFNYSGKRYWLFTVLGQGACSHICTDEYFNDYLMSYFKK